MMSQYYQIAFSLYLGNFQYRELLRKLFLFFMLQVKLFIINLIVIFQKIKIEKVKWLLSNHNVE